MNIWWFSFGMIVDIAIIAMSIWIYIDAGKMLKRAQAR